MLFLKHIENVKNEDILRLREVNGDVVFSVRTTGGIITSLSYLAILSMLEDENQRETSLRMAEYELGVYEEMTEETKLSVFKTSERACERKNFLELRITDCKSDIEMYRRLRHFFWQKVESFRAGLITEFNQPLLQDGSSQKGMKTGKIDQEDLGDKFKAECEQLKLEKGKSIPQSILFEIASRIGIKGLPQEEEDFNDKNTAYHIARQYASLCGYKKTRRTDI